MRDRLGRMVSTADYVESLKARMKARRAAYIASQGPDYLPLVDPGFVPKGKECPGCEGVEWIAGEAGAEPCPRCQPPKQYSTLEDFTIPPDYPKEARRQMEHAKTIVQLAIESGGPPWIVLHGPNGNGKTLLATILLSARQKLREPGQIWRAEELVSWLRETQGGLNHLPNEERHTISARLDHIRRLKWLVLDELGKERHTEFAMEQLEAIINRKYVDKSGLIVTTNFDPTSFDSPFSPAVRSRFGDKALCEIVSLEKVPDYRPRRRP